LEFQIYEGDLPMKKLRVPVLLLIGCSSIIGMALTTIGLSLFEKI
jgi:hypothetical protein